MTTPLRSHLADVLAAKDLGDGFIESVAVDLADALLADPTLRAIIDLAAWANDMPASPEARALLASWRAER